MHIMTGFFDYNIRFVRLFDSILDTQMTPL